MWLTLVENAGAVALALIGAAGVVVGVAVLLDRYVD